MRQSRSVSRRCFHQLAALNDKITEFNEQKADRESLVQELKSKSEELKTLQQKLADVTKELEGKG